MNAEARAKPELIFSFLSHCPCRHRQVLVAEVDALKTVVEHSMLHQRSAAPIAASEPSSPRGGMVSRYWSPGETEDSSLAPTAAAAPCPAAYHRVPP